jgi:hypothetical protein
MIPTCFSDTYSADTPTASMTKLAPVARAAELAGYVRLHDPGLIDRDKLRSLHDPAYVWAVITGKGPFASAMGWEWTPQIRNGVLAINAGMIEGARMAMETGIAANVAQGFHHAKPERGWYFCTFNGLALVAQEFPQKRIFVLDCDEHCGDGTAEFTKKLPNLFNFSINGTNWGMHESERSICRHLNPVKDDFTPYRNALEEAFKKADANADGMLTIEELRASMQKQRQGAGAGKEGAGQGGGRPRGEKKDAAAGAAGEAQ